MLYPLPSISPAMRLIFGTEAAVSAFTSLPACCDPSKRLASVTVKSGMCSFPQRSIKAAAFSKPSGEILPPLSIAWVAMPPTAVPLRRIKPIIISLPQLCFNSKKKFISDNALRISLPSPRFFSSPDNCRFKSSLQGPCSGYWLAFAGRRSIKVRI